MRTPPFGPAPSDLRCGNESPAGHRGPSTADLDRVGSATAAHVALSRRQADPKANPRRGTGNPIPTIEIPTGQPTMVADARSVQGAPRPTGDDLYTGTTGTPPRARSSPEHSTKIHCIRLRAGVPRLSGEVAGMARRAPSGHPPNGMCDGASFGSRMTHHRSSGPRTCPTARPDALIIGHDTRLRPETGPERPGRVKRSRSVSRRSAPRGRSPRPLRPRP